MHKTAICNSARPPLLPRWIQLTRSAFSRFRWGLVAVVFAASSGVVYGQTLGGTAPEVTPPLPTGQDTLSPREQAAENYGPQGIPVGSFMLFPTLELDEVYDDNIF